MLRGTLISITAVLLLALAGCSSTRTAVPVSALGSSSYRRSAEVQFNGTGSYVWRQSGSLPTVMNVEMVFANGIGGANTFTLSYVRGGITRDLIAVTDPAMRTMTWYVPSERYPRVGDVWQFSNTLPGPAILTIDLSYQSTNVGTKNSAHPFYGESV